jgi:hypothetical protein
MTENKERRHQRHAERMATDPEYVAKRRAKDKRWYANNPEKIKEKAKRYYTVNREKLNAYCRQYDATHGDEILERKRRVRVADPEKAKAMDKKHYLVNRETKLAYHREYGKTPAGKAAHKRYEAKNPFYVRQKAQVRRARKRTTQVEPINNVVVFERDLWVCQICGGKVDISLEHPHPFSSSLDHRIPLAKGGTHTMDNIQLAHLTCNVKKHAKVVAA